MSRLGTLGNKLYRGEVSYDFVDRRNRWYVVSAVLLAVSIGSLVLNGLTLGIEFRGGTEFRFQAQQASVEEARSVVADVTGGEVVAQRVGGGSLRVQTEKVSTDELQAVRDAVAQRFGIDANDVSTQSIGASWGQDIAEKALRALVFFLLGLVLFLSLYFEWKMALAAILALVHDLVITVGIYSLIGFEVTPATVIGFLTILGYSLYDTVVVFDKVRENTAGLAGGSRMSYSQAANLALNQTLVRSINTSVIALLPIAAILFAGVVLLGAGPLKDLALALFIGVATGTYSSIFIATPLLAQFKEREPAMQALARRAAARRGGATPTVVERRAAAAKATADEDAPATDGEPVAAAAPTRPAPRPAGPGRQQPRRPAARKKSGKKKR